MQRIRPSPSVRHQRASFILENIPLSELRSKRTVSREIACILLAVCYSESMGRVRGLNGMRHIALKVTDMALSKNFYQNVFGMEVVWEPDPQNVYLSSGCDNIALHEISQRFASGSVERQLDHFGFVVESIERVKELEREFRSQGVKIVNPFKIHRDGSASFYCADPDGIVIQMLYEPHLSPQNMK